MSCMAIAVPVATAAPVAAAALLLLSVAGAEVARVVTAVQVAMDAAAGW